jgi:hypothetical protein
MLPSGLLRVEAGIVQRSIQEVIQSKLARPPSQIVEVQALPLYLEHPYHVVPLTV